MDHRFASSLKRSLNNKIKGGYNAILDAVLTSINDFLYVYILTILLLGVGVYFTFKTRFVQFRLFGEAVKVIAEKKSGAEGMTSFQAFMIATGSRVGVGNIAGVTSAIAVGGPGAVFWMWCMALLGCASSFVECSLGQLYKVPDGDQFRGGPAFYIQQGLGSRFWGVLYAILITCSVAYGWNSVQAYNIAATIKYYIPESYHAVAPYIIGSLLVAGVGFVIFGGVNRIGKLSSVVVPVMSILYILFGLLAIALNLEKVPVVFSEIFKSAFDVRAITGGIAGSCIVQGIKRGLFSNEAGMGTGPYAAAAASSSHPAKQGLCQMISVFVDTIIICTITMLLAMLSGVPVTAENAGMPHLQQSVSAMFGEMGIFFLPFALCNYKHFWQLFLL